MLYVLAPCVAMIMFGTSLAIEPSCPLCSKYDYEERLLERVLSNELALKNNLNKITETHAKVEAENVKLNDAMHALEVKKKEIDEEMKAGLRTLRNELDILKGPLVMFHARHLEGSHTYTSNQDILFKTVLTNEGGGYDSNTGRFTASVAGVYMFTVQYCSPDKWGFPEIVHEGRPLQRSGHVDKNSVCVSMQAFAKLAIRDKVWVRSAFQSSEIYSEDIRRWSSFAGLLIRA